MRGEQHHYSQKKRTMRIHGTYTTRQVIVPALAFICEYGSSGNQFIAADAAGLTKIESLSRAVVIIRILAVGICYLRQRDPAPGMISTFAASVIKAVCPVSGGGRGPYDADELRGAGIS